MESGRYFRSVLKGTIGTLILSFIGVAILSLLMTKLVFSKGVFNMIYVIISLCSLSLGAIMGAKKNESKGWLVGIGVAAGYYFVLFILSSIFSGEMAFKFLDFAKLCICILVGTLAGMLGINL